MPMNLRIEDTLVEVTWEDNPSVSALKEKAKGGLSLSLHLYGGFEQVGPLGFSLPSQDRRLTTEPGDIMLYESNQIVLFYGSNTWEYTKLGHMEASQEELAALLGQGGVTIHLE